MKTSGPTDHFLSAKHLNLNANNNTSIHKQDWIGRHHQKAYQTRRPSMQQQEPKKRPHVDDHESANLCDMWRIDIHTILNKLHLKFMTHNYYTEASANTLIALNPFKDIPEVYSARVMDFYNKTTSSDTTSAPAHIFKQAANAWNMIKQQSKQTILVSGDSGSGKTRSINFIIHYYSYITSATAQSLQIKDILLKTNQILESFGNAKTALNDNSSRFGKYIKLHFSRTSNELVSAELITYLLEKTRSVNYQSFNFHIFYQLLFGCTDAERAAYLIDAALLNKYTGGQKLDHAFYTHKLNQLKLSFDLIDLNAPKILSVISAIAHLNCCVFASESTISPATSHHLSKASALLEFDVAELTNYLLVHELRITNCHADLIQIPCNLNQIKMRKDALVKLVYNQLFKYLVKAINKRLQFVESEPAASCCIGLLDIYGFESMLEANSLEQLCINYANEKLQKIFTDSYFKLNKLEYESEFPSEHFPIEYSDNLPLLTLVESSTNSLFCLLNEQSILKSHDHHINDDQLLIKLRQTFVNTDLIYEPKLNCKNEFFIRHYAGHVGYKTDCLMSKNADHVPDDLLKFVAKSHFLSDILADCVHKMNWHKKSTVLSKFKKNLDTLIANLNRTNILYVRCIKPNCDLRSDYFNFELVRNQLESCGIVSLLNLSKRGFIHKFVYSAFALRYKAVVARCAQVRQMLRNGEFKGVCEKVVEASGAEEDSYRLGRSKIFVKEPVVQALDALLANANSAAAATIQRGWRAHRRRVLGASALVIQSWWRSLLAKRVRSAPSMHAALGRSLNSLLCSSHYSTGCLSITSVQSSNYLIELDIVEEKLNMKKE